MLRCCFICDLKFKICVLVCLISVSNGAPGTINTELNQYYGSNSRVHTHRHSGEAKRYVRRRDKRLSRWGIDVDVGEAFSILIDK